MTQNSDPHRGIKGNEVAGGWQGKPGHREHEKMAGGWL